MAPNPSLRLRPADFDRHGCCAIVDSDDISLEAFEEIVNRGGIGSVVDEKRAVRFGFEELMFLEHAGILEVVQQENAEAVPAQEDATAVEELLLPPNAQSAGKTETSAADEVASAQTRRLNRKKRLSARVYAFLKNRNFTVKSGLKFGADFLIYTGKQGAAHAEAAVLIVQAGEGDCDERGGYRWQDVVAKSRLCGSVGKQLVLVDRNLKAVRLKRWVKKT